MNKILTNKYFKLGLTCFLVVASCIIFFFLIFKLEELFSLIKSKAKLFSPFIIGFFIAYLLNPIVKFFEIDVFQKMFRNSKIKSKIKNKLSRFLAITHTCILMIAIFILLFSFIIPELLMSIETLITNAPTYFEQLETYLLNSLGKNEDLEKIVLNNYDAINTYFLNFINTTLLPKVEEWIVVFSNGIFGALKTLYNIMLGCIISIYFLSGKETFKAQFKKALYSIFSIKTCNNIIDTIKHTNAIFESFILGKFLDSFIIGLITFVYLSIFNYPYALLIGIIVGATNIIPYFGPFIGGAPSTLLILIHSPSKCLVFILFLIALHQLDGVYIGPKLAGTKTGLKSFWVLFAIIIFGGLFGLFGMVIGVPLFALIYGFIKNKCNNNLIAKDLPTETSKYEELKRINSESKKIIY